MILDLSGKLIEFDSKKKLPDGPFGLWMTSRLPDSATDEDLMHLKGVTNLVEVNVRMEPADYWRGL